MSTSPNQGRNVSTAPVGYGNRPDAGYGQPVGPVRNGMGVAALVLGILAIVTSITVIGGILLGIVAIVLGVVGRGRANRGEANNRGVATAGIVTGAIGALLSIALIVAGVSILNSSTGKCIQKANGNQAAAQQCVK